MPAGVPVATVAIGGAQNAALLAAQILGVYDADIEKMLAEFKANMADNVRAKDSKLQDEVNKL